MKELEKKSIFDKTDLTDQQFVEKIEFYKTRYGTLIKAYEEFAKALNRNYQLGVTAKNVQNRYYYILKHRDIPANSKPIEAPKNSDTSTVHKMEINNKEEKKTLKPLKKFRKDKKDFVPRPVGVQFLSYWDYVDMPKLIKNIDTQIKEIERLGMPTSKNDMFRYYANMFNVSYSAFVAKYNYYKKDYYSKTKEKRAYSKNKEIIDQQEKIHELEELIREQTRTIDRLTQELNYREYRKAIVSENQKESLEENQKESLKEKLEDTATSLFGKLKSFMKRG